MAISLKDRYKGVLEWFKKNVPSPETELNHLNPYQLITAVILSAQCTDKRVNLTTPVLFKKYPCVGALAAADLTELTEIIKSISFPNNKARHLIGMAKLVVEKYGSELPSSVEELQTLPGVGRKTANVVASIIYDKPVIAVDTHVFRVSRRIGLSNGKTVEKVEEDLTRNIPEKLRAVSHHWLILHGRYICVARKPKCSECGLTPFCKYYSDTIASQSKFTS